MRGLSAGRDFARPGHIFPLRAVEEGVLRRAGHTEAAVDLARLAGFKPIGLLCEVMNEDGTMARLPQLLQFGRRHAIAVVSIASLIEYRRSLEAPARPGQPRPGYRGAV